MVLYGINMPILYSNQKQCGIEPKKLNEEVQNKCNTE